MKGGLQLQQALFIAPTNPRRFALEGRPFSITFFLGDVPNHSAYDFADDLTAISRVYNFSSNAEGRGVDASGCGNCKEQRDSGALFSGQVILTDYLIERITQAEAHRGLTLTSLEPEEVVPYLKANLHWRITDVRFLLWNPCRGKLTHAAIGLQPTHSKGRYAIAQDLRRHGPRNSFLGGKQTVAVLGIHDLVGCYSGKIGRGCTRRSLIKTGLDGWNECADGAMQAYRKTIQLTFSKVHTICHSLKLTDRLPRSLLGLAILAVVL